MSAAGRPQCLAVWLQRAVPALLLIPVGLLLVPALLLLQSPAPPLCLGCCQPLCPTQLPGRAWPCRFPLVPATQITMQLQVPCPVPMLLPGVWPVCLLCTGGSCTHQGLGQAPRDLGWNWDKAPGLSGFTCKLGIKAPAWVPGCGPQEGCTPSSWVL